MVSGNATITSTPATIVGTYTGADCHGPVTGGQYTLTKQ
jgi:hypothetical protein